MTVKITFATKHQTVLFGVSKIINCLDRSIIKIYTVDGKTKLIETTYIINIEVEND